MRGKCLEKDLIEPKALQLLALVPICQFYLSLGPVLNDHLVVPPKKSLILENPFGVLLALIIRLKVLGHIRVDGGQPRNANLIYPIR